MVSRVIVFASEGGTAIRREILRLGELFSCFLSDGCASPSAVELEEAWLAFLGYGYGVQRDGQVFPIGRPAKISVHSSLLSCCVSYAASLRSAFCALRLCRSETYCILSVALELGCGP